jgi:hypothetical protein
LARPSGKQDFCVSKATSCGCNLRTTGTPRKTATKRRLRLQRTSRQSRSSYARRRA